MQQGLIRNAVARSNELSTPGLLEFVTRRAKMRQLAGMGLRQAEFNANYSRLLQEGK